MKNNSLFIYLASLLTLSVIPGCGEDSNSGNCQKTQTDCDAQNKTLDAENCTCIETPITQKCETDGFVKCNDTCIDPKNSINFCGANENCENYTVCKDSETCLEGRCRPTKCEADEHHHDVICEKDSVDNCGEHGFKCAEHVEGWNAGEKPAQTIWHNARGEADRYSGG